MHSETYGSTEPIQRERKSPRTLARKSLTIVAFIFVIAIGYFTLFPAQSTAGLNRQYAVEDEEAEPIYVLYSHDEMMAYADDMSPGSDNLKAFQAELLESEGIAEEDQLRVQFMIVSHDDEIDADRHHVRPIRTKKPRPTKAPKPTKGPKPTKAPKTKRPRPTKAPKPTPAPVTDSDYGLECYTVTGGSVTAPNGFTREDAICPSGIRTGCSAVYTGALSDYKGNWGVTASYNKWTPDRDQGCAAGYYGRGKQADFQVQARCCEDAAGVLGVAIKKGQTKAEVEVKFDDGEYCIGTLNEDLEKQDKMYLGCLVSADIEMDGSFGDSWSGSLDPGFGGVRRRPDGTCKGQTYSAAATDTCTGKDVDAGVDCMDAMNAHKTVIYLDEEDVLYMESVKGDQEKMKDYKQTLILNAGYSLKANVEFEIPSGETADWLKVNCGGGYWAAWRDSQGWQLETVSVPREVNGKKFECTVVEADWSVYNKGKGLYESVIGCSKDGGSDQFNLGALVDCNGYLDDQMDVLCSDEVHGKRKNFGTFYDGELCKAQSDSDEIRAQAVCCTYQ